MRTLPLAPVIAFIGAGALMGVLAFALTAAQPTLSYLGPAGIVRMIDDPGFDPWTGMGHGRIYEMADFSATGPTGQVHIVREPGLRTWLGTRHAIPVPLGIIAAWIALAFAIAARHVWSRRRRNGSQRGVLPRPMGEVGEVGVEPTRPSRDTGS